MLLTDLTIRELLKRVLTVLVIAFIIVAETSAKTGNTINLVLIKDVVLYAFLAFLLYDCKLFNVRITLLIVIVASHGLVLARWLYQLFYRVIVVDMPMTLIVTLGNLKEIVLYSLVGYAILMRLKIIAWLKNKSVTLNMEYRQMTGAEHLILYSYIALALLYLVSATYFGYFHFFGSITYSSATEFSNYHQSFSDGVARTYWIIIAFQLLALQSYQYNFFRTRWLEV